MMRIVSFNVNGLRSVRDYFAVSKKWSFDEFLQSFGADIICLQETKVNEVGRLDREFALPTHYTGYFAFQRGAKKIGYSGVVTFCRRASPRCLPVAYEEGFTGLLEASEERLIRPGVRLATGSEEGGGPPTLLELDSEGRCIITDHQQFVLVHVYFPNDSGPERHAFRARFYPAVWERCLQYLRAGRSVILLGDINLTYHPIDHCDYAKAWQQLVLCHGEAQADAALARYFAADHGSNSSNNNPLPAGNEDATPLAAFVAGFYQDKPLRAWLYRLLHHDEEARRYGLRDVFRSFHPGEGDRYTNWSTVMSARGTNHGTRIDLILTAGPLFGGEQAGHTVVNCDIWPGYMGSDHCPVLIELDLPPSESGGLVPAEPRNLRRFTSQKRLCDFFPTASSRDRKQSRPAQPPPLPTDSSPDRQLRPGGQPEDGGESVTVIEQQSVHTEQITEWRQLFNRPKPAPLCKGHGEPCRLLTVSKRGLNQGRKFYACARGPGDPSEAASRCAHFEWYSAAAAAVSHARRGTTRGGAGDVPTDLNKPLT